MTASIFGPFETVEPKAAAIPRLVVGGPNGVSFEWLLPGQGNNGAAQTSVCLPPGWFYEYVPAAYAGSPGLLRFWNAGGAPSAVQLSATSLRLDFGQRDFGPLLYDNVPFDAGDLMVEVHANGPTNVFPTLSMTLGQALPVAVFQSRWAGAVDLRKTTARRVESLDGSILLHCRVGFPNGGLMESSLAIGATPLREAGSTAPKLAIWPARIRRSWRYHRIFFDACVPKAPPDGQLAVHLVVECQSVAGVRRLMPAVRLDGQAGHHLEGGTKGIDDGRTAILLPPPPPDYFRKTLHWLVEYTSGSKTEPITYAALLESGVLGEEQSPARGAQHVDLSIDLGTTTTVVGMRRGQDVAPLRIDLQRNEPKWAVAWAGGLPSGDQFTETPWLPWVRAADSPVVALRSEFPTALAIKPNPQKRGDSLRGEWNVAMLVNHLTGEAIDPGVDPTHLDASRLRKTADGYIKWESHRSSVYGILREAYLEQILLLALHDAVDEGGGELISTLVATAPGRFGLDERRSYAHSLDLVRQRLAVWTGAKLHVESKTLSGEMQNEVEPLLHQAARRAYLGDDSGTLLVLDMGGETLDVGLYLRLGPTNYVELYSASVRAAGHGALRAVEGAAQAVDGARLFERLTWRVRSEGMHAVLEDPKGAFQADRKETAREHILVHSLLAASVARSMLVAAPREVERVCAAQELPFSLDLAYARTQEPRGQGETDDQHTRRLQDDWLPGEWKRVVTLISGHDSTAVNEPKASPTEHRQVGGSTSGSEGLMFLRSYYEERVRDDDEAKVLCKRVIEKIDEAIASLAVNSVRSSVQGPPSPSPTQPVSSAAANPPGLVLNRVSVFLTGNGWKLSNAIKQNAASMIVRDVLREVATDVKIQLGEKSDAACGALQNSGLGVWQPQHAGVHDDGRCPHGLKFSENALPGVEMLPALKDPRSWSEILGVLRHKLGKDAPQVFEGPPLTEWASAFLGRQSVPVVERTRLSYLAKVGTDARARLASAIQSGGVQVSLQQFMLEALYSSKRGAP